MVSGRWRDELKGTSEALPALQGVCSLSYENPKINEGHKQQICIFKKALELQCTVQAGEGPDQLGSAVRYEMV